MQAWSRTCRVFFSSEVIGSPFVEMTFFPEDIGLLPVLREEYIAWVQQEQLQPGARRCSARYGNVSWQFGETGTRSGVFLVGEED